MKRQLIFISTLTLIVFGCAKSQVVDTLVQPAYSDQASIVTILPMNLREKKFAECVQAELAKSSPELKFIAEEEFRDALFPWFEPSTIPNSEQELSSMMNHPQVRERIQSIGIRFVIFVGSYKFKGVNGAFFAVGGFGSAGVFGYTSADRKFKLWAVIWDLEKMVSLGEVEVGKSGSVKLIGIILPIPIKVQFFTESGVCRETAERISNCLKGKVSHGDK